MDRLERSNFFAKQSRIRQPRAMRLNFDPTGERGMFNDEMFRMSLISGHIISRQISFHFILLFVSSHPTAVLASKISSASHLQQDWLEKHGFCFSLFFLLPISSLRSSSHLFFSPCDPAFQHSVRYSVYRRLKISST